MGLRHAGRANTGHPRHALCHRLLRHQGTLCQVVRVPDQAADNNPAERSLPPRVIARKTSGGTRSALSSHRRLGLDSLVATWQARSLNPFAECFALLPPRLPLT